jgi:O-antigen ligase
MNIKKIWTEIPLFPIISWTIALYLLFSMISISLSQIFIFLSFLCWIAIFIRERSRLFFPSFFWPLILYSALSLISSFLSVNPELSLKDSRELLLFLIVPIVYMGFQRGSTIFKAHRALLASGYTSLLYSLFYFLFRSYPGERITGFMGHYMTQAGLLLLFSTAALSMFFYSREKWRYLWGIGYLLSLAALTLTLTRSAWLGIIVSTCAIILLYKPKILILVPVAAGLLFLASPHHIKQRALSTFSLKNPSNRYRIEYIKTGISIIKDQPLFGTGPDTVDLVFKDPRFDLSEEARRNVHLHNNIIQIAAERGIPTLLSWLAFMIWGLVAQARLLRKKEPSLYPLAAAALAALLGLATAGLFEYNFGDSEIITLFLYMMTIPAALDHIRRRSEDKKDKTS